MAAHFTGPDTLSRTVCVLGDGLGSLAGDAPPAAGDGRVGAVVGDLAGGYATALRERAHTEQDQIYQALLVAREQVEQRLAVSEARFRAMFAEAAIGIGIGDLEGRILDANPALLAMFGYSAEELAAHNVSDMVHPDDAPSVWESYRELVAGRCDDFRVEKRFIRADGAAIWTNLTVSLVRDPAGAPSFQVALLEDITERRRLQIALEHQAFHDPLTGLPNRAKFAHGLAAVFADPAPGHRVGLCYLDLDGFKTVNDTLGHDVGDELLAAVAARLSRCCGDGRLLARMGGDEFVILLPDTRGVDELVALAEAIHAALVPPFTVGANELTVGTSIGIIEQPVADTTPTDLVAGADITLYWAKDRGRNRYEVYDRDRIESHVARLRLSSSMLGAIHRGEFFVEYQPLVSLADAAAHGVEALVRWRHPGYGVLGPDRFIGLAEQSGVIVSLGRWVLARACTQARAWHDEFGDRAPLLSVNLAPRQLQDPGLVEDVSTILGETGLPAGMLQLELTEQAVMGDEPGPLGALRSLSRMGVRIVIDDFGTGYSNMSYLHRLPVHGLKLDASFVSDLDRGADAAGTAIVSALIALAHALNLTVTAEGIETPAQLERLRALGCDAGQGWLFGPAGPPEKITTALQGLG